MCLALCLGVVCFALAGNAWAGTTRLATPATVPSNYALENTFTPTTGFGGAKLGNTYKLVGTGSYSSDIYRDLNFMPSVGGDFYVVVQLPADVFFQAGGFGSNCPAGMTCVTPLAAHVPAISLGTGGANGYATFTMVSGGINGASYVTYRATVVSNFTQFPTVQINSGTAGWTIRDFNNRLATGPIQATVQTYTVVGEDLFDVGSDTVTIAIASQAVRVAQALSSTTAAIDFSAPSSRTRFIPIPPDTTTEDNGASMGIGYSSPVPLNILGTAFTLSSADKVRFTFTSSTDFTGIVTNVVPPPLPTASTTSILYGGIYAAYAATGTTRTLDVPGNSALINTGAQPFKFVIDGFTPLAARTFQVKVDLILNGGGGALGSTPGAGTEVLAASADVTKWSISGGTVLLANWLNGNTTQYNSRIYLYNPSPVAGEVTARVFKMPPVGGTATSAEITTPGAPISLGILGATSAMNIKLKEDILNFVLAALPGGALPYTENGGNLIVQITVAAPGISGTCQVFSGNFAFGQVPLVIIP